MRNKITYIIGIDPSGAFNEGKGTTGYCVIRLQKNLLIKAVGELRAIDYDTAEAYWQAHLDKIKELRSQYHNAVVSVEDYVLYASKALSQTNSHFETSQLIGCIKLYCWQQKIKLYMRPAVAVKLRWSDIVLVRCKYLTQQGKEYYCKVCSTSLSLHIRDSIRHAVHCGVFDLKKGVD